MLKLHSQPIGAGAAALQRRPDPGNPGPAGAGLRQGRAADLHRRLAEASRQHPDVALGASPRASLCLLRLARARALLDGRHYFTHEDVQAVALGVLGHRLIIRPEAEVEGRTVADIVRDLLESVPVLGM